MPDNLNNIKHSKDTIAGDMKNAVISLIKMCTDGLTFLAHGNNLLNQTHRNCITCLTSSHVELGKKVPENSDWLSGGNILSRINQIKPKQQALRSYWFKKLAGILQKLQESTKRVLPETAKQSIEQWQLKTKPAKEIVSSKEKHILKQVNKYELITEFRGGKTKLFAKTGKYYQINIF